MNGNTGVSRVFESGATRDTEEGKLDYEGFLSPVVLERYGRYMHKHRIQSNGTLRDSDNWQRGMEVSVYMKSLLRHVMDVWKLHRDPNTSYQETEEALCGVLFNTQGMLYETIKMREQLARQKPDGR
jgi:hypothetical protein